MTTCDPGPTAVEVTEVQRPPLDYLKYVFRSSERRLLLVEGKSDRDLFRRLFERVDPDYGRHIMIDTADRVAWDPGFAPGTEFGNRARVARVCSLAGERPEAGRLVGVIDREYDDFRFNPHVCDDLPGVRVEGRLVRTRGHSVENYLFDFATFGDRMREYVPDNVATTVTLFERVFEDAVRIACAVGLACYHHPQGNFSQAVERGTVGWKALHLYSAGCLQLDYNTWRAELASKLPSEWADVAVAEYARWLDSVQAADFAVVRWLCHGHIGMAVIWAAVARCVFEAAKTLPVKERNKLADEVRKGPHEQRLRGCIDRWVEYALGGDSDCPHIILEMLGLSPAT